MRIDVGRSKVDLLSGTSERTSLLLAEVGVERIGGLHGLTIRRREATWLGMIQTGECEC